MITFFVISTISSCKKSVEEKAKDYVLNALVKGLWHLEKYEENGFDATDDFKGYEFQFHENGNLEAIKDLKVDRGNWSGDVTNLTMTIHFSSSGGLLTRLNHVWQWLDSHIGLVFAETTTASGKISIRLRRN